MAESMYTQRNGEVVIERYYRVMANYPIASGRCGLEWRMRGRKGEEPKVTPKESGQQLRTNVILGKAVSFHVPLDISDSRSVNELMHISLMG